MHNYFIKKINNPSKVQALEGLAKILRVPVDWICAIINFETGGTFSTTIVNKTSGAVGLIQFMPDFGKNYKTIDGKKYTMTEIKNMSFVDQCGLISLYFKPYISKVKSFTDLYLAVFFPLALGKDDNFVLQTSKLTPAIIASQNKAYDINKDNKVTKGEVTTYFANVYKKLGLTDLADSLKKNSNSNSTMNNLKAFYTANKTYILVALAVIVTVTVAYFTFKKK